MIRVALIFFLLPFSASAVIMSCEDRIEGMKAEKEKQGLGHIGDLNCKEGKKQGRAVYKAGTKWECKKLEDYPCVDNKKLRMVQCDREWECIP